MSSITNIYTPDATDPFIIELQQFPTPELPEDAVLGNMSGEAAPFWGMTHTEESRLLIAQSRLGKTHSEETIKLMSKPRSEKGKRNMSISRLDYYANNTMTEETREKLRILWTGRQHTPEACEKMRKVALNKKPCPHCGMMGNAGTLARHIKARHS